MTKAKKYLKREYFEQDGEWSLEEHLRRHKELIKQRKEELRRGSKGSGRNSQESTEGSS